jgi:NADP-dependent 3-hydroxy acid dehydrogenase YdfG
VDTEFSLVRFKGDVTKANLVYKDIKPLSAEDIANAIDVMVLAPPHVNYADIILLPSIQASARDVKRQLR